MLAHIGEREAASKLQKALEKVYSDGTKLTGDLGGKASTEEFTDAVIAAL
jgi:isocitrate dehydrogenase (NAD+)